MARFSVTVLAVLAAALVLASPAGAVDPLSVTSTVPADGAFRPPTPSGGIPFQVVIAGVPADANVSVTVSSSPATGPAEPNTNRSSLVSASARRPVRPASDASLSVRKGKEAEGERSGSNARRTGERQKGDSK